MSFKKISLADFNVNPFTLIGKQWMLITAADGDGKVNTMTAAWGGLGVMWNKNVAYVVIRPTRYTKQFVDASTTFSLTFFDDTYKQQLEYLGRVSGRDEDKITKCGLTILTKEDTPYFQQASKVLLCRKLYAQPFVPEGFVDDKLLASSYPKHDYHTLYIGEVIDALANN